MILLQYEISYKYLGENVGKSYIFDEKSFSWWKKVEVHLLQTIRYPQAHYLLCNDETKVFNVIEEEWLYKGMCFVIYQIQCVGVKLIKLFHQYVS